MLGYVFWHRPYAGVARASYEESLLVFQERLTKRRPPGLIGCASFRVDPLPWLGDRPGYEDWCLLEGSWAMDPLNAWALISPVGDAHDIVAAQMEEGHGGLYSLVWGEASWPARSTAVWLTRPRGIQWRPVLENLREQLPATTLWRRQMVLGPGKEFALIVPPETKFSVPAGWTAMSIDKLRIAPT